MIQAQDLSLVKIGAEGRSAAVPHTTVRNTCLDRVKLSFGSPTGRGVPLVAYELSVLNF